MENNSTFVSEPNTVPQPLQGLQNGGAHVSQVCMTSVQHNDWQDCGTIRPGVGDSPVNNDPPSSDHVGHSLRSFDFSVWSSALKVSLSSLWTFGGSSEPPRGHGTLSRALELSSSGSVGAAQYRHGHGHGSRIRKLMLEHSIVNIGRHECFGEAIPNYSVHQSTETDAEGNGAESDECESAFDFLSLSTLAAIDFGLFVRPSWGQLAQYVGSVARMEETQRQLEQRRLWAVGQVDILKNEISTLWNDSDGPKTPNGDSTVIHTPEESLSLRMSSTGRKVLGRRHEEPNECSPQKDLPTATNTAYKTTPLSYASKQLKCEQQCRHLQEEILQLEEDIQILRTAQAELRTLLQFAWKSAGLSLSQEVSRYTFRRLWCTDAKDASQAAESDRLFWLCFKSHRRAYVGQHRLPNGEAASTMNFLHQDAPLSNPQGLQKEDTAGTRPSDFESSSSLRGCGKSSFPPEENSGPLCREAQQHPEATLSFEALLMQLPPRSFECLWYAAEVRRKRKQHFRYYWL